MNRSLAAVGALACAVLFVSGCSGASQSPGGDEQKSLTLGVVGIESFDPPNMVGAGEGLTIWQGVYDTLITFDGEGDLAPGLAIEWSYDEALTALTLDLRSDVTFSDGSVFDAAAVEANYEHFVESNGANLALSAAISGVVVVDEDTVRFDLSQPDPGLEHALTGPLGAMVSPEALDAADLATNPVGTGPYVVDTARTSVGAKMVYERRDEAHWNEDAWAWDEIVFTVMPDQSARINALRAGEIDGTTITASAYDEVEGSGFEIVSAPGDTVALGLFDREGVIQPALADVRVRQAINYAFDREAMLESIQLGHGEVVDQIFSGVQPIGGTEYTYDPERAMELLAEAGYADGFELTGVDLGTGSPLYAIISDRLDAIGIDVTWQAVTPSDALSEMFSGKYPILVAGYSGAGIGNNPWSFVTNTVAPGAVWNVFKNAPPDLAALIEKARNATGSARDEAYAEIDGWMSTNAWFVPFYRNSYLYAVSRDVSAVPGPGNATPFLWSFQPAQGR